MPAVQGGYDACDRARRADVSHDALHYAILPLKYEEVARRRDRFAEGPAGLWSVKAKRFAATGSYRCRSILSGSADAVTTMLG